MSSSVVRSNGDAVVKVVSGWCLSDAVVVVVSGWCLSFDCKVDGSVVNWVEVFAKERGVRLGDVIENWVKEDVGEVVEGFMEVVLSCLVNSVTLIAAVVYEFEEVKGRVVMTSVVGVLRISVGVVVATVVVFGSTVVVGVVVAIVVVVCVVGAAVVVSCVVGDAVVVLCERTVVVNCVLEGTLTLVVDVIWESVRLLLADFNHS